ncbi:glycosyltransferase family 2 protein [Desulfobacter curvatus]|uniref:glycosyltransferase family 2 protein n=1 Tax=Desulfobacter curvatus TaxID=2290 RepID=UPI0003725895|nr:glycosyltransferase family 2 protein [Desulfobacter curvatus]
MKLSVIIPIYNENKYIDAVIKRIRSVQYPNSITHTEIIIVNDGSIDGSCKTLEKYHHTKNTHIYNNEFNFGKGFSIRVGLSAVTGEIVLIQDADLEYDPSDYGRLLSPILNNETSVVYGSRFLLQKFPCGMTYPNWFMNKVLCTLTNTLFQSSISDVATGYKVFKTEAIKEVELSGNRFNFCPEITAKLLRKGHVIKEVPISYRARTIAEGKKIKWYDGINAIWTLIRVYWTHT